MSVKSLIIGTVVGACAGILLAPASGRATRNKIRDKAVGMGHDVTDFVESKSRHLTNKMQGYKSKAQGMTQKMKDMVGQKAEEREMAMAGEPTI